MHEFSYHAAFQRTIGWVTPEEQEVLRHKRVAVGGLGGVGGVHLVTLARLGVGGFNIADMDRFDLANLNRQAGATVSTLGRPKVDVMAEMLRDINPEAGLRTFPQGIGADNLHDFLTGVDVYIDGLDFFAFEAREATFAACADLGVPAITVAPLGMGAAALIFVPGKMSFEEYFQVRGKSEEEKAFRFLLGLSPAMLQRRYLVEPSAVDFARRRGPSTAMACQLCAGIAATEALKLMLNRGKVIAAPRGYHFDAYRNKLAYTWRPWGNRNPLQRLAVAIATRQLSKRGAGTPAAEPAAPPSVMERILDGARWAPSGDNTQPWRFEIVDESHLVVHGFDTRRDCLYDFRGQSSYIAHGALLETIAVCASGFGLAVEAARRGDSAADAPLYDLRFTPQPGLISDPLLPYVKLRSVQRRPLSAATLGARAKAALEAALGAEMRVLWFEGLRDKWRVARMLSANGRLRLLTPEAYTVHRGAIARGARFSADKIPDAAVGLDPVTTRLMHWAMASWDRVSLMNRYLGGTWVPGIELDVLPALACGAHFVFVAARPPETPDDFVAAGRALQRFWLTATRLGLRLQPEMTPLIFSWYVRAGLRFSSAPGVWDRALAVQRRLEGLIGPDLLPRAVIMGRIGSGPAPKARSLRLPLEELMWR